MRSPKRIISLFTAASLFIHSMLMAAAAPTPAYALTLGEAQDASGRIGAGTFHSLALVPADTVIAWGGNDEGQSALGGLPDVIKVAAGGDHSLALKSNGTVVASGLNSNGQCQVPQNLSNVIAIAAGEEHSLALRGDGTVVAWGGNSFGQSTVPAGLNGVVAIAAGGFHSLALKSDGKVVAWGANGNGQSTVPSTLTNVVSIAAGGFHSIALRSNGAVTGWGRNSDAQATPPSTLAGVVAVAAGWRHSLALKSDGKVVAWGGGGVESSIAVPSTLDDVVSIAAGYRHSLALRADGTPVGWGLNESGQCLGPIAIDPAPNSRDLPTSVAFRTWYNLPIKAGGAYGQIRLEDVHGSPVAAVTSINGTLLTVTPSAPLQTDKRYVLRVPAGALVDDYVSSIGGNTYYYDTLDTVSPYVVSVQPIPGTDGVSVHSLVSVEFSEPVMLGSGAGVITLTSDSGHTAACLYSIFINRLVITPLAALQPMSVYTLVVPDNAITDIAGNPLAAQFTSGFTTGQAHTITTVSGVGGSISPSGTVLVDHGSDRAFTISPDAGYTIDTVTVGGTPVTLVDNGYTFTGVTEDQTITATFTRMPTVTLSVSAPKAISPGAKATIKGALKDADGKGVANRTVTLRRSVDGVSWTTVTSMKTTAAGEYLFSDKPTRNTHYRVVFAGDGEHAAKTSGTRRVRILGQWRSWRK